MSRKAIVIGAGIAGIASAIRLSVKGFDVTVFEAFENAGGKLNQHKRNAYRFDRGPSLFTLPHLVDELFYLCGEKPDEHFCYSKLNNTCKYFYEDGSSINAWADKNAFGKEVDDKTSDSYDRLFSFLNHSQFLYSITSVPFIFNSFNKLSNYFSKAYLRAFINLPRLNTLQNMHRVNSKRFSDNRMVQLFDRYATYNGSNPYKAPATLNVIAHLEHNIGTFFPDKGMYDIVESLVALAQRQGVQFVYNTRVEEIILEKSKVKAVKTKNDLISTDVVISDMDVVALYQKLLPDIKIPKQLLQADRSTSALIFYWGVKKEFSELDLHNILFSKDYQHEFNCLFDRKNISNDPTVYIFISSKHVIADAPNGCENWFVMINAPENVGQDWNKLIEEARENIINKINRLLNTDIEEYIEFEDVLDPIEIEKRTSSWHGSLYGNSSNSTLSAFRRHPNFLKRIKGLYFCGGSVHPGGGIPLCLASAKIATDEF